MIFPITPIVSRHEHHNKCKHCHIANLCLPAKVDKNILKEMDMLKFNAKLLKPGQHLCRQGEYTDKLYAIRTGILKSYYTKPDGTEYIMGFHMTPDLFGWEGIDNTQLSMSIVALDNTNVCEIPIAQLTTLFSKMPGLETRLFQMISQRIKHNNLAQLRSTSEQRVADFLLQLNEHYERLGFTKMVYKLPMAHQDVANYLRIAPETFSRTLRNLQTKKIIKTSRKKVSILDVLQLREIAEVGVVTI